MSYDNESSTIVVGRELSDCRWFQQSKREAANFDAEFTKEDPVLTPVPADVVRTINQVRTANSHTILHTELSLRKNI